MYAHELLRGIDAVQSIAVHPTIEPASDECRIRPKSECSVVVFVEFRLDLVRANVGVLNALEGKDMIGYRKTEEAFS